MSGRWVRIRTFLGLPDPNYPRPALEDGERALFEGAIQFQRGFFGGRVGRLILTNRRLLWQETARVLWPFKRIGGQVHLSDLRSVDRGSLLDFVFGGQRLRLRDRNGKDKCFFEADGRLNEWIAAIRDEMRNAA